MRKLFLFFYFLFHTIISAQGGSLDLTFTAGTGTGNYVSCMALQKDSKILIGGQFHTYNGAAVKPIVRLFSNGALDVSFNAEVLDNFVLRSIAVQENGKILVCGYYNITSNNDPRGKYFFRLNEDGTVDNTFNMGTGANFETNVILLQPDGKILLGGDFTGFNGVSRRSIARLNEDGSLDTSFVPGNTDGRILALALQADGKIVIGKAVGAFPSPSNYNYYRVNTDGTKDLSFREGLASYSEVHAISVRNDGKILIGGNGKLVRLNSDGNLDSTFVPYYSGGIYAIEQQTDGKYIVGPLGSSPYLIRMNNDGSKDASFLTNAISGPFVFTLLRQPDNKILVGGTIKYNNNSTSGIARILSGNEIMSSIENVKSKFLIYPNPVRDILNIKTDNPISSYKIYSLDGRKLMEENKLNISKIDVSNLTKGNYLIKFQTKGKEQTIKFIKE